jgi:Trk K+ transport system NAD-binding subunit
LPTDPAPESSPLTVILGGDMLAFDVCRTLVEIGNRVVVVWHAHGEVSNEVVRRGAIFAERHADEQRSLRDAGIESATVAMALTDDDHDNLSFALTARDINPNIRIVLRQFNRTLGRKIEQQLPNCSVLSLSSHSASTYAGAAVDRGCFYGLQFPDVDGPLVGFIVRSAEAAGVAGDTAAAAETKLRARIVACNGSRAFDLDRTFEPADDLTYFASVEVRETAPPAARDAPLRTYLRAFRASLREIRRPDPVVRTAVIAALVVFVLATTFFNKTMHLGALTAAYFVLSTMTTTGYGDISPGRSDVRGQFVAMLLMVAGLTFSGTFIAVLSARLADARYVATQGLRRVTRRGHIIVCGAGNVGSRVIDQLVKLEQSVVVVETLPKPETIARSRAGEFQLLTGDASKDATLDLCNVPEAAALIALTNSDTMNLEIALGARARSETLNVVMRVQQEAFEASVRRHFGFERVYGTAALAAPVFAGLAIGPGLRGRVTIDSRPFGVRETDGVPDPPEGLPDVTFVPLAVWRDGAFVPLARFEDVRPGDRVLSLVGAAENGA